MGKIRESWAILVCPSCKGALQELKGQLICAHEQLAFPIKNGIPILLISESVPVTDSASTESFPE